jgi:hypothetical protein
MYYLTRSGTLNKYYIHKRLSRVKSLVTFELLSGDIVTFRRKKRYRSTTRQKLKSKSIIYLPINKLNEL